MRQELLPAVLLLPLLLLPLLKWKPPLRRLPKTQALLSLLL